MLALFCWLASSIGEMSHSAEATLAVATQAIIRTICRDVYWHNARYRLGQSLPLEVRLEDNKFYAWLEDLEIGKNLRMAYFYEGGIKDEKGAITFVYGYNLASRHPQPAQFFTQRDKFQQNTIRTILTLPNACPLELDPLTPEKGRMIQTVVETMEKQLRLPIFNFPDEVTITIADFNVDYPLTYVLINQPSATEMVVVYLHDPDDWDGEKDPFKNEYRAVFRRIGPEHRHLLARIKEHGIIRKIVIKPKPSP